VRAIRALVCATGVVVGAGAVALVPVSAVAGAAGVQVCGDVGCSAPAVPAEPVSGPASGAATSALAAPQGSSGLAFTGADIAGTTIFALGALGVGAALVGGGRRSRRRAGAPA